MLEDGAPRLERIAELRERQAIAELERKAHKARNRSRLWTQEEIDLGRRLGQDLWRDFQERIE